MSHIENTEKMLECVTEKLKAYMDNGFENADTNEVGAVSDVAKDLAETLYYSKIAKAMDDAEEEDKKTEEFERMSGNSDRMFYGGRHNPVRYYGTPYYNRMPQRTGYNDSNYEYDKMYYTDSRNTGTSMSGYDTARRNYTETRDAHKGNTADDKEAKMRELEKYLNEMSADITGLVSNMSEEEKNLARNKISVLATKIV